MATSESALTHIKTAPTRTNQGRHLDLCLLAGIAIAAGAIIIGISCTGVGLNYFLQPTGAAIVLGGTLGVILITTPGHSLLHSLRRVIDLIAAPNVNREALIEEIVSYARAARRGGIVSIEPLLKNTSNEFLRDSLQLAVDVNNRAELESLLDTALRMAERQGETDAKALEVAGGFAPTIGIMGTVVGLIEVLRQFSNLQAVGYGIGTAFVSTIYGLALANLLLLPAAHRIRSRVAENFETQELIMEGVLAIVDTVHPSLIRTRLNSFLRGNGKQLDLASHAA
ncbi:MAG TPA: MotA/TolQ/ExbB proton channel family protein [Bryobacteraceae bacterium]|nr:MotA/TolQ/ExbB proton channel family protein [Bryobacteraceae bacterium]